MRNRKIGRRAGQSRLLLAAAVAAPVLAWAGNLPAASLTWDSNGNIDSAPVDGAGNWDTSSLNWWNGSADVSWDNAANDTAVFGAGGSGDVVTLTQTVNIGGLNFNVSGYTLTGGGLAVTGATPVSVADANTATISSVISGDGSLNINVGPTATLILGAANTYTGGSTLTGGGTVSIGTATEAFGTGAATLNGVTLGYNDARTVPTALNIVGTNTLFGTGSANGTFSGALSGDGTLVYTQGGTITPKNGDNSAFTGTIQFTGGGFLRFASTGAASENTFYDMGDSGKILVRVGGNNTFKLGAVSGGATSAIQSTALSTGLVTYEIGGKNLDTTFDGTIVENAGSNRFTAIRKVGTGKWTLGGVSTYTGRTSIEGGTLALSSTGTLSGTPTISINGGALDASAVSGGYVIADGKTINGSGGDIYGDVTLGVGGASTASLNPGDIGLPGTFTLHNNFKMNGGTLRMDISSDTTPGGSNDLLAVAGGLDLTGGGTIEVGAAGMLSLGSTYKLVTYTPGSLTGSAASIALKAGTRATLSLVDSTAGELDVHVDAVAPPAPLKWNGTASGDWDVNLSQNWLNTDTNAADFFFQGDSVTFDDQPGVQTTINLNTAVFPSSMVFNNTSNNYTISGSGAIRDVGTGTSVLTVVKNGDGVTTISTANSYSGGTQINAGTLAFTNVAGPGTGSIILNGGTVAIGNNIALTNEINVAADSGLANPGNASFNGALTGSANLNVALGTGTFTPAGDLSAFEGTVDLSPSFGGFLRFNGDTDLSKATLNLGDGQFALATVLSRTAATIQIGALSGSGTQTRLLGTGSSSTETTYVVGAKNLDSTFSGQMLDSVGPLALTKVGTGVLTLAGVNSYTGVTTVQAGKLVLGKDAQSPVLNNAGGADVQGGRLVLDYNGGSDPASQVLSILDAGFDQTPKFSTGQIRTSNPDASDKGLGWKDDTGAQQVTVAYTYYGDANLDGQVDVTDLGALATNWQTSNVWAGGDFNYDGFVDVTDLGALATNWQKGVGSPLGAESFQAALQSVGLGNVSVPEPASLGAIGICLAAAASRRRTRRGRRS